MHTLGARSRERLQGLHPDLVKVVEMTSQFQAGRLVSSKAVLDAPQGKALVAIASGLGEKVQAELRTPAGVKKGQSDGQKDVNL